MPDYRICLITQDNHIASTPIIIVCDDDKTAVQHSQKLLDRNDIQLCERRPRRKLRPNFQLTPFVAVPRPMRRVNRAAHALIATLALDELVQRLGIRLGDRRVPQRPAPLAPGP